MRQSQHVKHGLRMFKVVFAFKDNTFYFEANLIRFDRAVWNYSFQMTSFERGNPRPVSQPRQLTIRHLVLTL